MLGNVIKIVNKCYQAILNSINNHMQTKVDGSMFNKQ
jgi:hypothetical protein